MKTRTGFVSNSSASSFVVPRLIKDIDSVKQTIKEMLINAYIDEYGYNIDKAKSMAGDVVKNDIFIIPVVSQTAAERRELADYVNNIKYYGVQPQEFKFGTTWIVGHDNVIPDTAMDNIIEQFGCVNYNRHMG